MSVIFGTPDNDSIVGTDGDDTIVMSQGGVDTVDGGAGDDNIFFGGSMTADDRVDGGSGLNYLHLQGDYSAGLTFSADSFVNIQGLVLDEAGGGPTVAYNITMNDANVAAGGGLYVLSNAITRFDGRAETDGSFGIETHTWGDTIYGGAQDDNFNLYEGLTTRDYYNGGHGFDTMYLMVGQTETIVQNNIINIEKLVLETGGGNFDLTFLDGDIAAGKSLEIDMAPGFAGATVTIDGSREVSGSFNITGADEADSLTGGGGDDTLIGGVGADTLSGGLGHNILEGGFGADTLIGGKGIDVFTFIQPEDSLRSQQDHIVNLQNQDVIDLSAVDADITQKGNQAFHLVSQFDKAPGEAVLSFDGTNTLLSLDVDGDGKANMVIVLEGQHTNFDNFVL